MKHNITIGEKYKPIIGMTDKTEAMKYFEECVAHTMSFGKTREEAEEVERCNIGYFAGYYDQATRERVEELFDCQHPVFGSAKDHEVTPQEAFWKGKKMAYSCMPAKERAMRLLKDET
jgi:hypothetical protein